MWTNRVLMCGIDILLCLWAVYLFFFYFDIFFARKRKRYLSVIGITLFVIWQFGITTIISFPAYINIAVTIMFTFLAVMMTYEGRWWNKGVFVITFNAIWMLMETLCNYILITYCPQYAAVRQVGSFVSKIFFNAVILALKKVFTDDDIKELPVRYSILLVLIPTGSIYIMNNIFMLGFANNNGRTRINSTFTVLILLGMNILIFYVYMKLADDLRLRRMAAVYEQQLELCERHQQERELSMLQLRDIKHNMKNTERIIGKKHQLKWCTYQQLENNRYPTADVVIFHFTKEIIERERTFAAIIKIKGSLGHLTPILAISEGGSIQDIFSILKAGAYDYIETIDNTRKYKKKIENLILWNWYIKKHTSAKKRQC